MTQKRLFTDQMGNTIEINFPPKRIISLVPSQTELLYDLGLDQEVVGQTLFCIHPNHQHMLKPRVGGTKKLNLAKIKALQPDLIIGNKEENEEQQIKTLIQEFPVWMSDIKNLDDAIHMIENIGELVQQENKSKEIAATIKNGFATLGSTKEQATLYLIWREPWMAAGSDTFISDMLQRGGFKNVIHDKESRYPSLTVEEIKNLNPSTIFLSSEPYPFKENHLKELQEICPNANLQLVDGELFSWYGSRLVKTASYLSNLNH